MCVRGGWGGGAGQGSTLQTRALLWDWGFRGLKIDAKGGGGGPASRSAALPSLSARYCRSRGWGAGCSKAEGSMCLGCNNSCLMNPYCMWVGLGVMVQAHDMQAARRPVRVEPWRRVVYTQQGVGPWGLGAVQCMPPPRPGYTRPVADELNARATAAPQHTPQRLKEYVPTLCPPP